jgi:hypothetical protein
MYALNNFGVYHSSVVTLYDNILVFLLEVSPLFGENSEIFVGYEVRCFKLYMYMYIL